MGYLQIESVSEPVAVGAGDQYQDLPVKYEINICRYSVMCNLSAKLHKI
jgi:hypothetical protein